MLVDYIKTTTKIKWPTKKHCVQHWCNSPSVAGFTCASLNTSAWLQWQRLLYFVTVIARSFGDRLRYQFLTARLRDLPNPTFSFNLLSNCNSWKSIVGVSQRSCKWLFTACLTFISSVGSPDSYVVQKATALISTFVLATVPDLASFTRVLTTSTPLPATNRSLSTWTVSSSISLLITTARLRRPRSSSFAIVVALSAVWQSGIALTHSALGAHFAGKSRQLQHYQNCNTSSSIESRDRFWSADLLVSQFQFWVRNSEEYSNFYYVFRSVPVFFISSSDFR